MCAAGGSVVYPYAEVENSGMAMQAAPSRGREIAMLVGVCLASAATLTLIAMSIIFSYDPQLVVHGYRG